jgi:hypothetical protein
MSIPFWIAENGMFLRIHGAEFLMKLSYQVRNVEDKYI